MIDNSHRDLLKQYRELLLKWNSKINLISRSTEKDIWHRHIEDSLQIKKFLGNEEKIIDIGSGAGLPGMVLAIEGFQTTLIECDIRKVAFLQEVSRILEVEVKIVNDRVERLRLDCDTIICRGFAPLSRIFSYTNKAKYGRFLLLKGKNVQQEIEEANKEWIFEYKAYTSTTSVESSILEVINVQPK